MANLNTPADLLGALIDPRKEHEPLYQYRERLSKVAEVMAQRSLFDQEGEDEWVDAREQELSGRMGQEVRLRDGSKDDQLVREAEESLITWDNVEDHDGPFRWPAMEPRGRAPTYNSGGAATGGVAMPGDNLTFSEDRFAVTPGYALVGEELWYISANIEVLEFRVPEDTTQTVLVPWAIETTHPHRIVVESETEVVMIGADGHEHMIGVSSGNPTQTGYDEAGSDRSEHVHSIEKRDIEGPVFPQTRSPAPTSHTGGGTLNTKGVSSVAANRPVKVPHLAARTVRTNHDSTGHRHEVLVDPHRYWSGDFHLPGHGHSHQVTDWVVETADEHDHTIPQPSIPDARSLIPRLTNYEGQQLLPDSPSPYVINMHVEKGWTVANIPAGSAGQLLVGYEPGGFRKMDERLLSESTNRLLGIGPNDPASQIHTEVEDSFPGTPFVLHVRAEDKHTGGVPATDVTVTWDGGGRSLTQRTNRHGEAEFNIPTVEGQLEYELTITTPNGTTKSITVDLDPIELLDGYGIDYGRDYGS